MTGTINSSQGKIHIFRIIVEGKIHENLLPFLNGMTLSHSRKDEADITIVQGPLPDEASLGGILDTLIDRRFKLISVNRIEETQ